MCARTRVCVCVCVSFQFQHTISVDVTQGPHQIAQSWQTTGVDEVGVRSDAKSNNAQCIHVKSMISSLLPCD